MALPPAAAAAAASPPPTVAMTPPPAAHTLVVATSALSSVKRFCLMRNAAPAATRRLSAMAAENAAAASEASAPGLPNRKTWHPTTATQPNQNTSNAPAEACFATVGPPSSARSHLLRKCSNNRANMQTKQKAMTLKPRSPPSTTKAAPEMRAATSGYICSHSGVLPCTCQKTAAIVQGTPRPRKTLTELLPVTFTMDASAVGSSFAAEIEAKRSGIEVPKATKVIAVMISGTSNTQPNNSAKSETPAVNKAMPSSEATKHSQPPPRHVGGKSAKSAFQGKAMMCISQSLGDASCCSSALPFT
mmetsp:Transcript_136944/g.355606  ORF Transcript_136944/g.355606 Transcript_136944/m.355606 type:complete len:303 (-) Transcript_136944:1255-2163(-)